MRIPFREFTSSPNLFRATSINELARVLARSIFTSIALLGFSAGITGHYLVSEAARSSLYTILAWSPRLLSYIATFTMGLRILLSSLFTAS